jgi:nicotinamidase-related amidase
LHATALLVMDMQVGVIESLPGDHTAMLQTTGRTVAAARAAGVPVIYVVAEFREGYPEISERSGVMARLRGSNRLLAGAPDTAVHPAVGPEPGDLTVVKRRRSAFLGSELEVLLRARDVRRLVLTGVMTSAVVLTTLTAAVDLDFELVVLRDCCADRDPALHEVLVTQLFPKYAEVTTSADWLGALGATA